MVLNPHLRPFFHDKPFFINQKGRADDAHVFAAVQLFERPNTVVFRDFVIGVGQQQKRQLILLNEFVVRFEFIRTNISTKKICTLILK